MPTEYNKDKSKTPGACQGFADLSFFIFPATILHRLPNIYPEGGEQMDLEARWIRDIQKYGSRLAAERLILSRYDEIYAFVYRQVGRKEDAMDLTQEIFLAVLRALPAFDRRKASFRTWLYRIAANKVVDARRRARPIVVPLEEADLPPVEDFSVRVRDRLLLEQIEAFVSGLEPRIQAAFRLRLYGDKSFPEIAAILDQKEAAVKAQYYRLLGRLRKEFGEDAL